MSDPRRVVVTGIGTVNGCAVGGSEALAGALAAGRSAIGPVRAFHGAGGRSRLAAEVAPSALEALIDPDQARRLSRICQLAVGACRLALEDAKIEGGPDVGIVVGTEFGDARSIEEFAAGYLRRGPSGLSPMIFPNTVMNAMGAAAAIAVGARGPTVTVNQATVAGDLSVVRAAELLAMGRATAVAAGGVDELCRSVYLRLAEMGVLSPMNGVGTEGCRPFAPDHTGPVLGEGATFVVLEELESARARGAGVLAEVLRGASGNIPAPPHGIGPAADQHSPVRRLMRSLPPEAGVRRCYGSGNGDPGLDDWEMALLEPDLRGAPDGPPVLPPVSLAPLVGQHGGLGVIRVAAAALDVSRGIAPVLVHGIARGGCRTAVLLGPAS